VALKKEQEPTAHPIFGVAIGLSPIPGIAKQPGDGRTPLGIMVNDDLPDEGDIVLGYGASTISQDCGHAPVITESSCERTYFFGRQKKAGERILILQEVHIKIFLGLF